VSSGEPVGRRGGKRAAQAVRGWDDNIGGPPPVYWRIRFSGGLTAAHRGNARQHADVRASGAVFPLGGGGEHRGGNRVLLSGATGADVRHAARKRLAGVAGGGAGDRGGAAGRQPRAAGGVRGRAGGQRVDFDRVAGGVGDRSGQCARGLAGRLAAAAGRGVGTQAVRFRGDGGLPRGGGGGFGGGRERGGALSAMVRYGGVRRRAGAVVDVVDGRRARGVAGGSAADGAGGGAGGGGAPAGIEGAARVPARAAGGGAEYLGIPRDAGGAAAVLALSRLPQLGAIFGNFRAFAARKSLAGRDRTIAKWV